MNALQLATWVILGATISLQAYTFWRMRRTAKITKEITAVNEQTRSKLEEAARNTERII